MIAIGLLVFVPAGTLNYWQGWTFLGLTIVSSWISSIYLLRKDPAVLERRMLAPERRPVQKVLSGATYFFSFALVVVSVLDHRFGWSSVPTIMSVLGFVLVAVAIAGITMVLAQNSHAAITIRVEENQPLISTGIYGMVRHPMYTFNTFLYVGTPLALGSYWGLIFPIAGLLVFALRIRDEERMLQDELDGYPEYMQKVPHRLVPGVW
jgi:protein-S-isoprenylcysteine O-methyltransferase Ste14